MWREKLAVITYFPGRGTPFETTEPQTEEQLEQDDPQRS
jgi:hypothetical protein